MVRIGLKKGKNEWIITKNGRRIDAETSKMKAKGAAEFYRKYFSIPKRKRSAWAKKY